MRLDVRGNPLPLFGEMKHLVIVESPTKAKTIRRFLGRDYDVQSSFGHIRDLPKSKMGIDIEHDFAPQYVIPKDSKEHVTLLKAHAKKADLIYLATDEDREGEAISWHLVDALDIDPKKTKRIVFHEITEGAITHAVENPRTLNQHLVDAQQARRVLDRLVGYELSPLLWNKIQRGLSAGRVQSVALRLIVEREREIEAFTPKEYWSIEAAFEKQGIAFTAKLIAKDGAPVTKLAIGSEKEASDLLGLLKGSSFGVETITKKEKRRSAAAPFTTSTLQQESFRKLGYSSKQTMMIAQQLYEGIELGEEGSTGLITYMRTDSLNLSEIALTQAQTVIRDSFGAEYTLAEPRRFKTKSRNAQEAHEAIRPTDLSRTPESIKSYLDPKQFRVYQLIYRRTIASQMADARLEHTSVDLMNSALTFRATGNVILFDGFMRAYTEDQDEEAATETIEQAEDEGEGTLPPLVEDEKLDATSVTPHQHFTQPPARYSDASIVKKMEELGIGRPSTYASIISTIIARGYVDKVEKKFQPTDIGKLVNDVLVAHFPTIVDYQFTAQMEEDLDAVSRGEKDWVPVIRAFYTPFHETIEIKNKELNKSDLTQEKTDLLCEKCGNPMLIKMGRFGKFYACSNYPECKTTKPMKEDEAEAAAIVAGKICPDCQSPMVMKRGRFGPFLGCSRYPDCKHLEPIVKSMGVSCPDCQKGDIVEKKSKRGKLFYACNRYPECTFAMWQKPTGKICPTCNKLLVYGPRETILCSDKTCGYREEAE